MKSKPLQWFAIILILEVGLVHFFNAQHEFEEAPLLGYLFIDNFLCALVAAYGLYRRRSWGWGLGLLIALGSLVGYIWSRTAGLPGLEPEAWLNAWGVFSLVAEGLFVLLACVLQAGVLHAGALSAGLRPWQPVPSSAVPADATATPPTVAPIRFLRYLMPAAGLAALVLVNVTAARLETRFHQENQGHIFSLAEVKEAPVLSQQALEQQYGVQLSLVAVSSMDSIVDVRLKILDLEKAAPLLAEHSALLVGDTLILSPHQHRQPLKQGKAYIVFYPNLKHVVTPGTPVSLAFENLRLEPILAK